MSSGAVEQPFLKGGGQPTAAEFAALQSAGIALEHRGADRPSMIRLALQGSEPLMVKLWYPKKLWSSDRLRPYSERFRRNAQQFAERGFAAPVVLGWGKLAGTGVRYLSYREIPGTALRDASGTFDLDALAGFLLRLHDAGISFRALHLGNLLRTAGGFALIDISDCHFRDGALSLRERAKNLSGLCAHPTDSDRFGDGAWADLVIAYARLAGLSLQDATRLHHKVRTHVKRWDARRARARARGRRRRAVKQGC